MRPRVAGGTQFADALHLLLLDGGVDFEDCRRSSRGFLKPVDAHDDGLAGLDLLLVFERRVLDFTLDKAFFDGAQRPAHFVDARYVSFSPAFNNAGQIFYIFAAT